jgi:hypothetical protein
MRKKPFRRPINKQIKKKNRLKNHQGDLITKFSPEYLTHFRSRISYYTNPDRIKRRRQALEKRRKKIRVARFRMTLGAKGKRELCRKWGMRIAQTKKVSKINRKSNKLLNLLMRNGKKKMIINLYNKICILFENILKKNKTQVKVLLYSLLLSLANPAKIRQPISYRPPRLQVPREKKGFFYSVSNLSVGTKKKQIYTSGSRQSSFNFLLHELFSIFIRNKDESQSYQALTKFNRDTTTSIVKLEEEFLVEKLRKSGKGKKRLKKNESRNKKIKD